MLEIPGVPQWRKGLIIHVGGKGLLYMWVLGTQCDVNGSYINTRGAYQSLNKSSCTCVHVLKECEFNRLTQSALMIEALVGHIEL